MDQIHNHDWFKSNTDGTMYSIQQPSLAFPKNIGRPIKNRSDIDERLLETLKVLWTNRPAEQLIEALLNQRLVK